MINIADVICMAVTGYTHSCFSVCGLSDVVGGSDYVLIRSSSAVFVHALKEFSSHYSEEKCDGQPDHQIASKRLQRSEQPPFFGQEEITVTESRVGYAGKIKRRLDIR